MFSLKHQGQLDGVPVSSNAVDPAGDEDIAIDDDDAENEVDEDEESPFRDPPEGCVRLRPSQFNGVPSTVFVEYPPELGIRRMDVSVVEPLGARKLGYKSYWNRICIKNAHCRAGFQKSDKYWTSLWSKHQNAEQMKELNCLQKINHFPASWCIGRKDRLTRTLNTMKRVHGANAAVFDFHPETFILPAERDSLHRLLKTEMSTAISANSSGSGRSVKSFNSANSNMSMAGGMWIVKPCASSCGQGITVMTGQQAMALSKKKKAVVQRYLARPYLIDGRKFDLRIYVLVSGVDPLRVYIHDEGLTRISTAKYTLKNLTNSFAHLTNYSINKNAPNFKAAEFNNTGTSEQPDGECTNETDPEMEGFKWSLAAFRRWLSKKEGREVMEQTFDRIFDLCLKTMIAAEGEITPHLHSSAQYRSNCFELFGCDVILDSHLCPHLLEVNVSPSLMGSSPLDKKIKGMVIADTLHIVGMYPHDPALIKKYDTNSGASASAGAALRRGSSFKGAAGIDALTSSLTDPPGNPFAFTSLSKLMTAQDRYRRNPCPESIDIAALGDQDASWLLLLMAEDELTRAKSSKFHCVHPTPSNASYYTSLYRSCRFSDHLLAHWVMHHGSRGRYGKLIPAKYRKASLTPLGSPVKATTTGATSFNTVPVRPDSSAGARVRAKSAGRAPSATQRTSTYIPSAMVEASTSEKVSKGSAAIVADPPSNSNTYRSTSLSPRASRAEPEQHISRRVVDGDAQSKAHHKASRGSSEPRTRASAADPRDQEMQRSGSKIAFASPAPAPAPVTTPSSVRSRLESGIHRAAYYSGGIACDTSEFDDAVGRESVEVRSPTGRYNGYSSGDASPKIASTAESVPLRPVSRSRVAGSGRQPQAAHVVTVGGAAQFIDSTGLRPPSAAAAPPQRRPSSSSNNSGGGSSASRGIMPQENNPSQVCKVLFEVSNSSKHTGALLPTSTISPAALRRNSSSSCVPVDASAVTGYGAEVPIAQVAHGRNGRGSPILAAVAAGGGTHYDARQQTGRTAGAAGIASPTADRYSPTRGRNSPVLDALPIAPQRIDSTSHIASRTANAVSPQKHRQLSRNSSSNSMTADSNVVKVKSPEVKRDLMAQIQQTLLAASITNSSAAELKLARTEVLQAFSPHNGSNLQLSKAAPTSPSAAATAAANSVRPVKDSMRV